MKDKSTMPELLHMTWQLDRMSIKDVKTVGSISKPITDFWKPVTVTITVVTS